MNLQNPLVKVSLALIGAAFILSSAILAYLLVTNTANSVAPQYDNISPVLPESIDAATSQDTTSPEAITINKPQAESGVILQERTIDAVESRESFKNIDSAHDYANFERLIQEIGANTQGEVPKHGEN